MYLPIEQWNAGYVQLLHDCRGNNCHGDIHNENGNVGSVLLLCALDADAMCAARIFTYCFRGDGIPYQLRPCGSAAELERILSVSLSANAHDNNNSVTTNNIDNHNPQDLNEPDPVHFVERDNVRAVMLLNLGGMKNLTRVVNQYTRPGDNNVAHSSCSSSSALKRVYVLDSHRPIHLANLHAGNEVVVFVEDIVEDEIPSDGDWLSGDDNEKEKSDGNQEEGYESVVDDSDADSNIDSEAAPDDVDQESKDEGEAEFHHEHVTSEQDNDKDGGRDVNVDDLVNDSDSESGRGTSSSPSKRSRIETQKAVPVTDLTPNEDNDSHILDATQQSHALGTAIGFEEQVRRRKSRIALYYNAGTSFGVPSAWVAYTLCQRYLRFGNVGDLLWLACVGTTDSYLHGRIDTLGYAELAEDLLSHVQRLYPNDLVDRALRRGAVYALQEDLTQEQQDVGDNPSALGDGSRTTVCVSEAGKILCQKEFKFMLLRHWTLYDSMRYSNYVATKLQVYTTQGKQRLKELLARMGFPLEECQQSYAFMRPIMKGRLQQKLSDHAKEFNLEDLTYTGFVRVTGFKSLVSASDMVYAVTALLDCSSLVLPNRKINVTQQENESEQLLHSFNVAYDALNPKSSMNISPSQVGGVGEGYDLANLVNGGDLSGATGVGAGVRLAMSLQRSIVATSMSLVEKRGIVRLSHFRYAYVHATSKGVSRGDQGAASSATMSTNLIPTGEGSNATVEDVPHIFARPLALRKLAMFLMDMHRENGKWSSSGGRAKPLILMAENPQTNAYVVVGYNFCEEAGFVAKNRFGKNFDLAAKTLKGRVFFDATSWDGNMCEVDASIVQSFIEQLHYLMDAR